MTLPHLPVPDYGGGSIVNLVASVVEACGGERRHPPCRDLAPAQLAEARHVMLLVVDGMGLNVLERHAADGALRAHLRAPMTSVFPPTTASAMTSLLTGLTPAEHALTGWFTYFREIGCVAAPLPFRPRFGGGRLSAAGVEAGRLFHAPGAFDAVPRRFHALLPGRLAESDYTRAHAARAERHGFDSLAGLFEAAAERLRAAGRERTFVYAYWPDLDALCHEHGAASETVGAHLGAIDAAFARFLAVARETGTAVVATADHGFVDTDAESRIELDDHPELAGTLLLPLCGEPRAAFCYVRAAARERFEGVVRARLGALCDPVPSAALVERGLFGPGPAHPRLAERIGDWTLLMKGRAVIRDRVPGERAFVHVGVHGGTSEEELMVPLVLAPPWDGA